MLNSPCLYFFLIRPILEARTEIRKKFCWLFGVFKDTTISFWDFQTFNVSIPKLKDPSTSWLYYKTLTNKMFRPWFFWSYCTFDRDFLKKNQTMSFNRNCTFKTSDLRLYTMFNKLRSETNQTKALSTLLYPFPPFIGYLSWPWF